MFKFGLQKFLDYREKLLEEVIKEKEIIRMEIQKIKIEIIKERDLYFLERDKLNDLRKKGSFTEEQIYHDSLSKRKEVMLLLLEKTKICNEKLEFVEIEITKNAKMVKVLEKLKLKKHLEFDTQEKLKMSKIIDDIAIKNYLGKSDRSTSEGAE